VHYKIPPFNMVPDQVPHLSDSPLDSPLLMRMHSDAGQHCCQVQFLDVWNRHAPTGQTVIQGTWLVWSTMLCSSPGFAECLSASWPTHQT
jgi:hypothetical protein